MKIIAYYLPQFHTIPENDEWWGKGFTEWVNVKSAKPLFDGHNQPRIPLEKNYYNLLDNNIFKWQIDLAKKYGIYGFSFYHYWFNGHMLLEKPVENYLKDKSLNLPFCICWANEHWTKAWVSKESRVLIEQKYGGEKEWKEHFYYLLPYFKDDRYIKIKGYPLFIIYRPELIDCNNEMLDCWQRLAKENGLPGLKFAYQHVGLELVNNKDDSRYDYNIESQPIYAKTFMDSIKNSNPFTKLRRKILLKLEKNKIDLAAYFINKVTKIDYEKVWQYIINSKPLGKKSLPCAFVDFDNTSRRKEKGTVYIGANPERFYYYFEKFVKKAKSEFHSDLMFIFSWNEWAEGGALEPDEHFKYGYLEAIKRALIENDEFPE